MKKKKFNVKRIKIIKKNNMIKKIKIIKIRLK